jgi:ABC-type multidrug transport system ATPase subunit
LDEPFSGLDEANKRQAAAFIDAHLGNRILLLATHDSDEAALLGTTAVDFL